MKLEGSLAPGKKEHVRNVKICAKGSNVANHAWYKNHQIGFENASIIDKSNYCHLKTLETWHTAKTDDTDNKSRPLPNQYLILPNKQCFSHLSPVLHIFLYLLVLISYSLHILSVEDNRTVVKG